MRLTEVSLQANQCFTGVSQSLWLCYEDEAGTWPGRDVHAGPSSGMNTDSPFRTPVVHGWDFSPSQPLDDSQLPSPQGDPDHPTCTQLSPLCFPCTSLFLSLACKLREEGKLRQEGLSSLGCF